jgi:hypothetical protein
MIIIISICFCCCYFLLYSYLSLQTIVYNHTKRSYLSYVPYSAGGNLALVDVEAIVVESSYDGPRIPDLKKEASIRCHIIVTIAITDVI